MQSARLEGYHSDGASHRQTRSKSRHAAKPPVEYVAGARAGPELSSSQQTGTRTITALPTGTLLRSTTQLSTKNHRLLLEKQGALRDHGVAVPAGLRGLASALAAALVFAQEEAGTAVCVSQGGVLLTCAHCVAEKTEDLSKTRQHWLLFASGQAVSAECVAWDSGRDLALLQITAAQPASGSGLVESFPSVTVAQSSPTLNTRLVCIGHPGSEDLEASEAGVKTDYDVLHVSTGHFRGLADGQDIHDNSEIGALMHDCWTYWGHSGAPLLERKTATLVGLHSSWDDETAMRRGVPLEAIQKFLEENAGLTGTHSEADDDEGGDASCS